VAVSSNFVYLFINIEVLTVVFLLQTGQVLGRVNESGQVMGRVNVVSGHVKTQLIAHDKEVYDIAFSRAGGGRDMFASVGELCV
jgi:hypothetical protein